VVLAQLERDIRFVFCAERSQAASIERLAISLRERVANPVEVVQPNSLIAFTEWIANAHCVLSMESGGAHLATALNKRAVMIVGGGHIGYFAPWKRSNRQEWVHLRLDCFGCDWLCNQPYVRCIHDIPAAKVGEAIRRVWTSSAEEVVAAT
jgi:ADP-heptose:LPS heptosyltransferase